MASRGSDAKNSGNVAGGHKANLANPKTSEESKEHSRAVLEDMEASGHHYNHEEDKNPGNVIGGHKANLNNSNTSEESKQNSKKVLDEMEASQ